MFCNKCGNNIADDSVFCKFCGSSVEPISVSSESSQNSKNGFTEKPIKCPVCGEYLDSFQVKCPTCGNEIHRNEVVQSVKSLIAELNNLDRQNKKAFFIPGSPVFNRITDSEQQKINLIKSFPIPNSIEDIIEFMILAVTNIDMKVFSLLSSSSMPKTDIELSKAWDSKADQAYQKAKLSMATSPEFFRIKKMEDTTLQNQTIRNSASHYIWH